MHLRYPLPMYVILWQFHPRSGQEAAFEQSYGGAGAWVKLFSRADGYLGSELLRSVGTPGEYLCVDRWTSETAWEAFQARFGSEYSELDRALENLTDSETPLGRYKEI